MDILRPGPECDVLAEVDSRNCTNCKILDEVNTNDVDDSGIILLFLNVVSLPSHLNELEVLLEQLLSRPTHTFLGISETWLNGVN